MKNLLNYYIINVLDRVDGLIVVQLVSGVV